MPTQPSNDSVSVELLQCQLLSLVGLAPDEQLLLSSDGSVLYSPSKNAEKIAVGGSRPRFFLFSSAEKAEIPELPSDWREICTRSAFGDVPVVQPAFRKVSPSGDPMSTLICGPCARTCTTGFQPVNPMEWSSSELLASRFISAIDVVAGDVDVPAPPGFTKLPVDLNFSASGDYVYLCVKRGGPRVLTQLHVLFQQKGEEHSTHKGKSAPETIIDVDCNSGGAAGDGTGVNVRLGYDSVQYKGRLEQLSTLGVTDIAVVVGNQSPPSPAHVKMARNLNEGAPGAQPVFLYYKLSPLNGFACNAGREHSEFGECLFATRHLSNVVSPFDFDEPRLAVARVSLAAERQQMDAAFLDAHYRQHQSGMLQRLQSGLQRAQSYENKKMQEEALKRIPVEALHERARANPSPMPLYQDELVKQLLHWFKREFFSWMNQPRCSACGHDKTRSVRTEVPKTAEEVAGQVSRVEVYQCPACAAFTRFPRYNDPVKLLDTRTGRCGEWANCFTLCCRAMGFEARYVLDVTDHVWTEVYSKHYKRWLHCDSCEDQLDAPLTYEVGWGKKLSYIFSFARDEVVDTARRYTQNWEEMRSRRRDVDETWLETTINQINRTLREQQTPERVAILTSRAQSEREELLRGRSVKSSEVKGRVSGSAEWKSQRSEDGKQSEKESDQTRPSSTKPEGESSIQPSSAEILQDICRNWVIGCQRPDEKCTNPFCFSGRTTSSSLHASSGANERAVEAIQVVTALSQEGFSANSLAMLRCPVATEIRSFVWSKSPLTYLPLQDAPSTDFSVPLIDISGHGNHAKNGGRCALRKPFRIPSSGSGGVDNSRAFGLQLLPGQRLNVPVSSEATPIHRAASFIVRFDRLDACTNTTSDGVLSVLTVQMGGNTDPSSAVVLRVLWDHSGRRFSAELQAKNEPTKTVSLPESALGFSRYAHVAMSEGGNVVAVYINGVLVEQLTLPDSQRLPDSPKLVTLHGPAQDCTDVAAVVSHVAVLPFQSPREIEEFCATAKNFVSVPPLRAFGSNGERGSERCAESAAGAQSGYRVARVLLWGGEFFDGLQFIYEKVGDDSTASSPVVQGELVGNATAKRSASSPTVTLELLRDEVVTRVSGRKGAWTDCLRLETNFGRSITCGGKGGGDFSVSTPANSEVRHVAFKVGDHLTDASVFVAEPSSVIALENATRSKLQEILSPCESTARQAAVAAALRYLDNIARQPEELKFQRIRASNTFFASTVGVLGAATATAFMSWCGFKESVEGGEQFFCFEPSHPLCRAAEAFKRIHFLKAL